MTITIEREALVRVLDADSSELPCHHYPPLKPPSPGGLRRAAAEPPSRPPSVPVSRTADDDFCPDLQSLSDEDCISLSSYGSDASSRGSIIGRRVSFAEPLVTEVKTRPRTKTRDKQVLFYSQSETDRFRQLYREEREPLAPVNSGSPKPLLGRAGSAFTPVQSSNVQPDSESTDKEPPSAETSRRLISRVVVEHQDSFETFYDLNAALPGGGASEEFFDFDNDTFWSGSIRWY
ncbi:hypothetical protein ACHAXT_004687 [Thalassiosira profunda]